MDMAGTLVNMPCSGKPTKEVCDVLTKLNDIQSLRNPTYVFQSASACMCVASHLATWRERIEGEVKAIKPFATYV